MAKSRLKDWLFLCFCVLKSGVKGVEFETVRCECMSAVGYICNGLKSIKTDDVFLIRRNRLLWVFSEDFETIF